jgi:hypothetical protein
MIFFVVSELYQIYPSLLKIGRGVFFPLLNTAVFFVLFAFVLDVSWSSAVS